MDIWLILSLLLVVANGASVDKGNYTKVVPSKLRPHFSSRISNGIPAAQNQFPFYVYILAQGQGESSSCGGSILSSSWVLTAAHCTYNYLSLDLYFGSNDVYEMTNILTSTFWIEHENYDPTNYNNDLSVVQLPKQLGYTASIQPVSLLSMSQGGNSFVGQSALIMGFGYTSDTNPAESPDLLYTTVSIISNTDCTTYYGSNIITSGTMCAQGSSTQSICSGDSGGPIVIGNGNGYTQIGINSFVSNSGCTTGLPSGYIRLGSYLGWVGSKTNIPIS